MDRGYDAEKMLINTGHNIIGTQGQGGHLRICVEG